LIIIFVARLFIASVDHMYTNIDLSVDQNRFIQCHLLQVNWRQCATNLLMGVLFQHLCTSACTVLHRVTTHLENLKKSGNSKVVRENGKSQG